MAQDIRELLKQDKRMPLEEIADGHLDRFMERLEKELPKQKRSFNYNWLRIAASVLVIFSVSFMTINHFKSSEPNNEVVEFDNSGVKNATVVLNKTSSLAEISPDYEKAENYFLTSIKFGLSKITVTDKNRDLVDSFKLRLANLDKEYQSLNKELITVGPNIQSVEAMMENLRLRLNLLNKLKDKLKELESIDNEGYKEIQA